MPRVLLHLWLSRRCCCPALSPVRVPLFVFFQVDEFVRELKDDDKSGDQLAVQTRIRRVQCPAPLPPTEALPRCVQA
jgi:hypothetical protein